MPGLVVLDVIDELETPPAHCVHGRTQCIQCQRWCWLGSQTYPKVVSGEAYPACKDCAYLILNHPANRDTAKLLGNAGDHQRADGPHD